MIQVIARKFRSGVIAVCVMKNQTAQSQVVPFMSFDSPRSRRQFVKTFVLGSVATLAGPPWVGSLFGEIQDTTAIDGVIPLNLSDYPALLQAGGSVRVGVNPISGDFPLGAFYPVIVTRGAGSTFYAVNSRCTHRDCVSDPYNGTRIVCYCHGSEFAMDGKVTSGPATRNLEQYAVEFDGVNTLKVTVPGLGYSITRYALQTGATPRFSLEFPTFNHAEYEIRFRQTLTLVETWSVVPFSTTPGSAADQMVLTGDGLLKTVFVDRAGSLGFYSVAIRVKPV